MQKHRVNTAWCMAFIDFEISVVHHWKIVETVVNAIADVPYHLRDLGGIDA